MCSYYTGIEICTQLDIFEDSVSSLSTIQELTV